MRDGDVAWAFLDAAQSQLGLSDVQSACIANGAIMLVERSLSGSLAEAVLEVIQHVHCRGFSAVRSPQELARWNEIHGLLTWGGCGHA